METKQILLGLLTTVFVFGAYFIGLFQGSREPLQTQDFFHNLLRRLRWQGVAWAVALPTAWILLYYAFIGHVWIALGRWPRFGESLPGRILPMHEESIRYLFGSMVGSLYVVPLILVGAIFLRRFRHVSIYSLCYAAAVGLASGALFLAPRPFLNWLFD